jgi:hypothetical protein
LFFAGRTRKIAAADAAAQTRAREVMIRECGTQW